MENKKIVVFDFDECLGDFTLFYEYENSFSKNINFDFLINLKILRPQIDKVFNYLKKIKKKLLIILYTNATYQVPLYILKIVHKKYPSLFDYVISRHLYWKWYNNQWKQLNIKRNFLSSKSINDIIQLTNIKNLIMFDDKIMRFNKNKYMIFPQNNDIKYIVTKKNKGNIYLIPIYKYVLNKLFIDKLFNYIDDNIQNLTKKDIVKIKRTFSKTKKNNNDYATGNKILNYLKFFIKK